MKSDKNHSSFWHFLSHFPASTITDLQTVSQCLQRFLSFLCNAFSLFTLDSLRLLFVCQKKRNNQSPHYTTHFVVVVDDCYIGTCIFSPKSILFSSSPAPLLISILCDKIIAYFMRCRRAWLRIIYIMPENISDYSKDCIGKRLLFKMYWISSF